MSVYEIATESWPAESETDEERKKRLRKARNRRLAAIMRIFGLIVTPLPAPALPPPPPPLIEVDPTGKRRGGQGGSREAELAALPEGTVMDRLGRLAATTPIEAEAEAFAGALPMLAATLVPAATPAMASAASQMVSGMSSAARVLRESEQTTDMVRWLPAVARRTALNVGRRASRGRPVTPDTCARILADTAVQVLTEATLEAEKQAEPFWPLEPFREPFRKVAKWLEAFRTGRIFDDKQIQAARKAFEENAKKEKGKGRKECIVILNHVLRTIWNDPNQKHTNETMEKAMKLFERGGYASRPREVWFTGRSGKRTRGGNRPEGLEASVWRAVVDMAGGDPGWSVYGMSVMDGYHAVTLALDNRDPAKPKVFWSDQVPHWSGGWREYSDAEMNAKLLEIVQYVWDGQAEGKKHNPVIRLWRLRRTAMRPASQRTRP